MKPIVLILFISTLLIGCISSKKVNQDSISSFYSCTFKGDIIDIRRFLSLETEPINEIGLQVNGFFIFFEEEGEEDESLKWYTYDRNTQIFRTFKSPDVSYQLKSDTSYKMQIIDSTNGGFKLKVESRNKFDTPLVGKELIIECIRKIE